MSGRKIETVKDAVAFALAGNARLTLVSEKTGVRYTYQVKHGEGPNAPHFVAVLSGPDNSSDFAYLGTIFDRAVYRHGRKSRISQDAGSALAWAYAWRHLSEGTLPPKCEIWHEGRCGRCNRALTVPESIATGLGPECAAKSGT